MPKKKILFRLRVNRDELVSEVNANFSKDSLTPPRSLLFYRDEALNDELNKLKERWKSVATRADIYVNVEIYKKFNQYWVNNAYVDKALYRINQCLEALNELHNVAGKIKLSAEDYKNIEETLLFIIEYKLKKIESKQLRQLYKRQEIKRNLKDLKLLDVSYANKSYRVRKNIKKYKLYKIQFDDIQVDDKKAPSQIHKLFNHYKRERIDFQKYKRKFEVITDARQVATTSATTFNAIQDMYPSVVSLAQGTSAFLSSVPLIAAIASVIPPLIMTFNAWYKKQSRTKIALTAFSLCLAIAAVVLASVTTTVIIGAAVGTLLLGAGIFNQFAIPLIQKHRTIKIRQAEYDDIDSKISSLKRSDLKRKLDDRDKHALLRKLEDYYTAHPDEYLENKKDLLITKELIINSMTSDLIDNPVLKKALVYIDGQNKKHDQPLLAFLIQAAVERKQYLKIDLAILTAERRRLSFSLANATVSFIGAILILVPFPPVMIIGLILIGLSTVNAIAMKYGLYTKIINKIEKLFKKVDEFTIATAKDKKPKQQTNALLTKSLSEENMTLTKDHTPTPVVEEEHSNTDGYTDASLSSSKVSSIFTSKTSNTTASKSTESKSNETEIIKPSPKPTPGSDK
jgi:hypothetical protein